MVVFTMAHFSINKIERKVLEKSYVMLWFILVRDTHWGSWSLKTDQGRVALSIFPLLYPEDQLVSFSHMPRKIMECAFYLRFCLLEMLLAYASKDVLWPWPLAEQAAVQEYRVSHLPACLPLSGFYWMTTLPLARDNECPTIKMTFSSARIHHIHFTFEI